MASERDPTTGRLLPMPIDLADANAFVKQHHRHHKPVVGCKFTLAVALGVEIVGVAIVGRPVGRHADDGFTLEINRLCTDGTRNACSWLLGRVRRVAGAMGYRRVITYTLPEEGGASLRAAGYRLVNTTAGGGSWHAPNVGRIRVDKHPLQAKFKWEALP